MTNRQGQVHKGQVALPRDDLNLIDHELCTHPEVLVAKVNLTDGCRADLARLVPGVAPRRPRTRGLKRELNHEFLSFSLFD